MTDNQIRLYWAQAADFIGPLEDLDQIHARLNETYPDLQLPPIMQPITYIGTIPPTNAVN